MKRSGGQLVAAGLEAQGVNRVFCVPGESYLAVLDALRDSSIAVTVARQEGGAAMMAEAWGKLTGRPGVALVTRGPGATNAASGVHVAQQDATPMVLMVGQIARDMRGRDAFQEVDYNALFGGIAKWVAEIDSAARIPEMLSRAWHVAMSGRPGPVVLAVPQDMLVESAEVGDAALVEVGDPAPSQDDLSRLAGALGEAEAPLIVAGGSRWDRKACGLLGELAQRWDIPVAVTFRRQELMDNRHPAYAGELTLGPNPKLIERVRAADLLILIGDRMSELPSQSYELLGIPDPGCRLIHVHPGPEEIGRVYAPWLGIAVPPGTFLGGWSMLNAPDSPGWAGACDDAHASYLDWSTPRGGDLMSRFVGKLSAAMPEDTILTNGAGNYTIWMQRFHRYRGKGSHLGPTSGSMGYGLPAAIAAKLHDPSRPVICFAGDGCLQMTIQELGTAMQERADILVVVVDNGLYGTIRAHQARDYPGRVAATNLQNPDFAALAQAYGFQSWTVRDEAEISPVIEAALEGPGSGLIHVITDPAQIAPNRRLSD